MKSSIIGVLLRYLATTLSLILIILTFNIQALNYRVLSLLILAVIATLVTPVLYSFIAKHRLHFRVKSIVKAITPKYSVEVEGNKLFIYSGDGKVYGVAFAVVDDIPYTYFDLSRDELVYKIKNFVNVMSSIRDEILLLIIKRSVNETKFILNLERKISTLRVMRRADPTNIKIQRKLEQLEELYSRILKGERPIVVDYILAVRSQGYLKSRVSSELDVKLGNVMSAIEAGLNIRLREALEEEVEYILTFGILSKARSGIKVTSSHIAPFTPVNYTKKPKLDFENGIYLGRDVTTETPVIIN
ncbi:MAG TPA: hypothetical protein EYH40_03000, partial [Desulfurococcales archaeon]|nr:hypothetical protein [Desulfurococcales archaeon]